MWLLFIHKWRRINHSSDPSYRLTSSTIWHLLPLSLIHEIISNPISFHSFKVPFSLRPLIWTKLWPAPFLSIFWPKVWSFYISTLFYLILLSIINNTVWKTWYLSLNCVFIRKGLEPSFVLQIQLRHSMYAWSVEWLTLIQTLYFMGVVYHKSSIPKLSLYRTYFISWVSFDRFWILPISIHISCRLFPYLFILDYK